MTEIIFVDLVQQSLPGASGGVGGVPASRTVNGHPLSANVIVTKGDVGLANADNTADTAKPVSTAQAAADTAATTTAITTLRNGVVVQGDDLNKLYSLIQTINAIIGQGVTDADALVNTVAELLAVFATYPEGVNVVTALAGKIDTSAIVNTLIETTSGKVLDARQGKALNDLIAALTANRDASSGYAGLTLFKINFKNALNTFISFFTNANTAARTYTFQDRDGTIADNTDLALKAPLVSPALTGTPTAPTAAVATNTTQLATTAFVLANLPVGGGSKNYIDVTAAPYNAIPDNGTTDNTAAINAAISDAHTGSKKRVYFPGAGYYRCDGPLSAASTNAITLFGDGGRVEPTQDVIPSSIVYTGTGTKFFDAGKSHGLTIKGLGLQVSNALFTGDILSTNFTGGGVTYSFKLEDCTIGGRTGTARHARSGLHTAGVVECFLNNVNFGWSDYGAIGVTAGDTAFSTVVVVKGCRFTQYNQSSLAPMGGQQWIVRENIFEFRYDSNPSATSGVGSAVITNVLGGGGLNDGFVFCDNGLWDAASTPASSAWMDIHGNAIKIAGNLFSVGTAGCCIVFRNGGDGILVSSNRVFGSAGASFINLIGAGITNFNDDGTNLLDSGITKYVIPTLMGMANSASTNQTSKHLIAGGTAGSANTTSCPGAGTSPTVGANAQDAAGWIILTAGSAPSASSKIFNVLFNSPYTNQPVSVVLTPANAASAALSSTGQVFVAHADISATGFSATIGSTGLAAGVQYQWHYQVMGI